ncbi:MAG: hypothetical protein ACOX3V_05210 [Bacillota bacterium]
MANMVFLRCQAEYLQVALVVFARRWLDGKKTTFLKGVARELRALV